MMRIKKYRSLMSVSDAMKKTQREKEKEKQNNK